MKNKWANIVKNTDKIMSLFENIDRKSEIRMVKLLISRIMMKENNYHLLKNNIIPDIIREINNEWINTGDKPYNDYMNTIKELNENIRKRESNKINMRLRRMAEKWRIEQENRNIKRKNTNHFGIIKGIMKSCEQNELIFDDISPIIYIDIKDNR